MLGWLHQKLNALYEKPVPALSLAVFRIVYSLILIGEVGQIIYFRQLIFDPIPFLEPAELNYLPLLLFWLLVLVCLVLGLFTRVATILNYAFSLATFALFTEFGYHIDYAYVAVNFLFMLAPVSGVWALDTKLKIKPRQEWVSSIWAYLIFFFGVGFTYLDSAAYKLADPIWLQGWGVWFASSLLPNIYQDLSLFLNNRVFMQILGYLVLIFELAFPVLVFFHRFRPPGVVLGMAFHAGTLLVYPIPGFALSCIAFYLPLLPWQHWFRKNKMYDQDAFANPAAIPILQRDLNFLPFIPGTILPKFFTAFVLYCIFGQFLCLLQSDTFKGNAADNRTFRINQVAARIFAPVYYVNQKYLGLVSHEIFLARYFTGYEHLISIQYEPAKGTGVWLPITDKTGKNDYYNTGRIFCNWNYWVNSAEINQDKLEAGLCDYTAFWAVKNKISLQQANFIVRLKKVEVPQTWQKKFLHTQIQKPWLKIGVVTWQDGKCKVALPEVEQL